MSGISHQQAIQLIHRRLDGLLNQGQLLSLDEHLRSCEDCNAYASEMELLPLHLRHEFHARWDKKPGPSQNVIEHVTAKARNISTANRFSSGTKLFAGAMALILLGVAINFVISQLQSTSPVTNATRTVDTSPLPQERLLAFASDQNGNFDIYTMHADGTNLNNLTNDPARDTNPKWSPDGKRIAFESDRDGFQQIYLMDADGSNVVQLTKDESDHAFLSNDNDFNPWSPDGSRLLIAEILQGGASWKLYVTDVNGEQQTLPIDESPTLSAISWSPDGQHIALQVNDPQNPDRNRLYIVNADGSDLREFTGSIRQNESLFFTSDYHWSSDGQSLFFVAFFPKTSHWTVYEARWVGNSLIERATTKHLIYGWWNDIYVINNASSSAPFEWVRPDGTSSKLNPDEKCRYVDLYQSDDTAKRSPNGNWVVTGQCSNGDTWLYWANSDGTQIKRLLDSPIPITSTFLSPISWSQDDKFVVFAASASNQSDLYILDVSEALQNQATQPVKISKSFSPSWQPIYTPKLADDPTELKIDPQSCKPSTLGSVPGNLYGHDIVENISFVEGDFSYEFWLYCDSSLKPDDNEHFSAIAGLGVYALWRYNGPRVEGPVEYDYEFGQNEVMGKSSSDGPFYRSSAGGAFGIDISEATIRSYIRQGTPVQFRVTVNSSLGQNGAILSFNLEPTDNGLKIVNLNAGKLNHVNNSLIAFAATGENGALDIYTIYPDGSGLTNLTKNSEGNAMPAWSPDGRRIAFVSNRDGNENIYVMNADGSDLVRLTDDPATDNTPVWSPDGTKIAYTSGNFYLDNTNIYVMDANGQNRHPVTDYASKTIVFPRAWSPDSQYILFNVGGRIIQGNVNGGKITPITPETQTNTESYALTKDGSTFSYLTDCQEGDSTFCYRLRSIRRDEAQPDFTKWLATFKTPKEVCPVKQTATSMGSYIKWSPDQSKILFIFTCEEDGWIYIANADGSDFKPLTSYPIIKHALDNGAAMGDWSPDSQSVVFMSALDHIGSYSLYRLNINDALRNPEIRPMQLNTSSPQVWTPVWQPTP